MREPDAVLLQHRFRYNQAGVLLVSVLKHSDEFLVNEKKTCLTVLFCNA
jgi:hypothetical protein